MTINPDRLRELRVRKGVSRQQLADKSRISLRQITRLENKSASSTTARHRTINLLAEALNTKPGVLTGELPLPEASTVQSPGAGEPLQVSTRLWPEVHLAIALIERRYGVNRTTLFNAAPLMFVLLAEGSFHWRQEKLGEVEEAAWNLDSLGVGHLSFARSAYRAVEGALAEKASIRKRDLFGADVGPDTFELGYDRSTNNPFADYLRELARKIDDPEVIDIDENALAYAALDNFPRFKVCSADLAKIAGGSAMAAYALEQGHVRVSEIPDELWADGTAQERAEWLEAQLPEDTRDLFELFSSQESDEKGARK